MEAFFLKIYSNFEKIGAKYKNYILALKFTASVGLIFYLIFQVNFKELFKAFSNLDMGFFFLTFLTTFLATIFYNLRYLRILMAFRKRLPFWELYLINRFSNLINFFLPGGIGQELGRLAYIDGKKKVIASSLVDRFIGLFSIVIILLISVYFVSLHLVYVFTIILVTIGVFVFFLFLKKRFHLKIDLSLVWSLIYTLLLVLMSFLQFKAIRVTVNFYDLLFFVPLLNILLMLPISIQGYGLREYFWFVFLGISVERVLAYSLMGYFINLVLSLPGLLVFLRKSKKSLTSFDKDNS